MALSDKELKEINRHCPCGKPNFIFIKYYKWKQNNEKFMRSAGIFRACRDTTCIFYFGNSMKLNTIYINPISQEQCYFVASGFTLDNLKEV